MTETKANVSDFCKNYSDNGDDGAIGVSITFFDKNNPDQFKIIGKANTNGGSKINGKNLYTSI